MRFALAVAICHLGLSDKASVSFYGCNTILFLSALINLQWMCANFSCCHDMSPICQMLLLMNILLYWYIFTLHSAHCSFGKNPFIRLIGILLYEQAGNTSQHWQRMLLIVCLVVSYFSAIASHKLLTSAVVTHIAHTMRAQNIEQAEFVVEFCRLRARSVCVSVVHMCGGHGERVQRRKSSYMYLSKFIWEFTKLS